jgi:2-dehydrotetronate isomerase
MPRFSAHLTQLFVEVPFPQRFAAAAAAGFKGCEFRTPYEYPAAEVALWLEQSGLTNVLFNAPSGDWAAGDRGIAALPGREKEFRRGIALALEYARVLRTPLVHVMAGVIPAAEDRTRCRDAFIANLRYAAQALASAGSGVVIEPINTRDVPGYFLTTQVDAHFICEEVGAPNLSVQMDLYHAQVMEGDLTTKLRKFLPHIGHIQIAGVPDRNEPDRGEVNFGYLLRLLDSIGYSGWVGCEYVPSGRTEDGLGWMQSLVAEVSP